MRIFFMVFHLSLFCYGIGPLDDYLGYKGYWYNYKGKTLGFRILYPVGDMPAGGYPLWVMQPGQTGVDGNLAAYTVEDVTGGYQAGVFHTKNADGDDNVSYICQNYPCFVLVPCYPRNNTIPNTEAHNFTNGNIKLLPKTSTYADRYYDDNGILYTASELIYMSRNGVGKQPYAQYNVPLQNQWDAGPDSWYIAASISLINDIINGTLVCYTDSLFANSATPDTITINPDRVYYTGHSWGCTLASSFLSSGREIFAAATITDCALAFNFILGSAWVNSSNQDVVGTRYASRYKHIPIVYTMSQDTVEFPSGRYYRHSTYLIDGGSTVNCLLWKTGFEHDNTLVNPMGNSAELYKFDSTNHSTIQEFTTLGVTIPEYINSLIKPTLIDDTYANGDIWLNIRSSSLHDVWPEFTQYTYLHHNHQKSASSASFDSYEIVDPSTTVKYILYGKTYIIEQTADNVLIFDKGGSYQHSFSEDGERYIFLSLQGFCEVEKVKNTTNTNNRFIVRKNIKTLY